MKYTEITLYQTIKIKRIWAYLIDLAFSILAYMVILLAFAVANILDFDTARYVSLIASVIYLSKDVVGIGKRIMGLQVVTKEGKKAAWYIRFIRNISLYIVPVEIILFLIDRPRLGDRIYHTDVILKQNKQES